MTMPAFDVPFNMTQISLPVIPTPSGSATAVLVGTNPPAPPVLSGIRQSWLTRMHPEYARHVDQWTFAMEHYNGAVMDPDRVMRYLPRKQQAESIEAYRERTALADYTPHFSTVVDSLAGMLFSTETQTDRNWGALGDEDDENSVAGRLWANADGNGAAWVTVWKQSTVDLLVVHRVWVLVDADAEGVSRIVLLPVTAVRNWRSQGGQLVEAVVAESADVRVALNSPGPAYQEYRTQYVHYTTEGWTRYALDKDQREIKLDEGAGPLFEDRYGNPALPLFRVDLPLRRNVGYMLAKKANALYNLESGIDHLVRSALLTVKLNVVGDNTLFEKIAAMLAETGGNVLQNPTESAGQHHFIAPESAPAGTANAIRMRKVEEFYKVAFREYTDSAKQRTATEVRQEIAAGSGAILQLVKGTLDDAEDEAMWRLEQIEFPNNRAKWFKADVERTEDFSPADPDAVIDTMMKRYFGDRVPIGRTALMDAARNALSYDGFVYKDDAELQNAVDAHLIERAMAVATQQPLGAEARADIAIRWVQSLGIFEWDTLVDTGAVDEQGKPMQATKGALIEQEIRAVARAQMQAELRGSTYAPGQVALGGGKETEGAPPATGGGAPPPKGGAPPAKGAPAEGGKAPEIHVHIPPQVTGGKRKITIGKNSTTGQLEGTVE